jgi:hypothetical protein
VIVRVREPPFEQDVSLKFVNNATYFKDRTNRRVQVRAKRLSVGLRRTASLWLPEIGAEGSLARSLDERLEPA